MKHKWPPQNRPLGLTWDINSIIQSLIQCREADERRVAYMGHCWNREQERMKHGSQYSSPFKVMSRGKEGRDGWFLPTHQVYSDQRHVVSVDCGRRTVDRTHRNRLDHLDAGADPRLSNIVARLLASFLEDKTENKLFSQSTNFYIKYWQCLKKTNCKSVHIWQ